MGSTLPLANVLLILCPQGGAAGLKPQVPQNCNGFSSGNSTVCRPAEEAVAFVGFSIWGVSEFPAVGQRFRPVPACPMVRTDLQ